MELAAVVTGNPERQREARLAHPGASIVENAERLWESASQLDLIVIATPNRTHVPLALAALDAGLNVVVDKPLAPAAEEGRQLIEAARRKARMLTVFQNRRWDGDFLTLRRLLDEGSLGVPYRMESRFDRWRPTPKSGWRERGAPEEAGGLLYDLGSHLIDQALVLFGAVSHVYAELDRRRALVEVDDDAFVALEHVSGVRSHLFMSVVAAQPGPRFRITGSRAAYVKHGLDVQEAALRGGEMPGRPAWGEEPPEAWGTLGSTDDHRPVQTERGAYQRFYEGVLAAIRDGSPVPVDPEDSVSGLEIIEAARRSHTGRRIVDVS